MTDITKLVTTKEVFLIFPNTARANIVRNLPAVLTALSEVGLGDTDGVCMALATIAAETGQFVPIPEGQSHYNTAPGGRPFGLYDNRHDLGNGGPGMGYKYRGRGYVQLTGHSNYVRIGQEIGVDLEHQPDLACDPGIAARVLARFLGDSEGQWRGAIARGSYAEARRAVNGGTNGLAEFEAAYDRGQNVLPDDGA